MVYQGKSYREVGENLAVDSSSYSEPSMHLAMWTSESIPQILCLLRFTIIIILETVLDRPEVFLREIQQILVAETGT